MLGALTQVRMHGARAAALRALRDAEPATPDHEAALARDLAKASGFPGAARYFAGSRRRDLADACLAALRQERDLCLRTLFQAGLGALFVTGLATAGARLTAGLALFSAFLAMPTWALALGGPATLVEAVLSAPLGGKAARDLAHARLLSLLAFLLGAELEPATARSLAESLVGLRLPESALQEALARRTFAGPVALRAEAEDALLRAAARRARSAQIRFRFLILGVAAVALAALFAGGVTRLRSEGLLPGGPAAPGQATPGDGFREGRFEMPRGDAREEPAMRPATATSGSP